MNERPVPVNEKPLIQRYLQLRSEFIGYLYAMTRDAELAEEVYQDAAVIVIKKADGTEEINDFRAWAKEVIRRQALYAIREREKSRKVARAMSPELLEAISTVFVEDKSTESVVLDESSALKECLTGLTENKRKLIALRYENDASFQEISAKTKSSPSAIQKAISRIRKQLHDCVKHKMRTAEGLS